MNHHYPLYKIISLLPTEFIMLFYCLLICSKSSFSKNYFRNAFGVKTVWTQIRPGFFWPELSPNCLHRFSVDKTSR